MTEQPWMGCQIYNNNKAILSKGRRKVFNDSPHARNKNNRFKNTKDITFSGKIPHKLNGNAQLYNKKNFKNFF